MCDVRKGTSTRKPRVNPEIQQVQTYNPPIPKSKRSEKKDGKSLKGVARLRGVDRSSPHHQAVTINDVTVIITEFKPKPPKDRSGASGASTGDTSSLSESDRHSEASNGPPDLQLKPTPAT